jgi:hypothetical protein
MPDVDERWRDKAACRNSALDFTAIRKFADRRCDLVTEEFIRARAVCYGCPVIEACFNEAMNHQPDRWGYEHVAGFVAGTTERERANLRRRRNKRVA